LLVSEWQPAARELGRRVHLRRHELGLSQERLAERSALHRTYVADIERGARNPSLGSLLRLAEGLDVPLATLFKGLVNS
jgi:transcriptional regulator with XRE-family HTH domain